MAAGALYSTYSTNRQLAEGAKAIKANQDVLLNQERELEARRKAIEDDSSEVKPEADRIQRQYLGQKLGNKYR
jgi:hypothetical protein